MRSMTSRISILLAIIHISTVLSICPHDEDGLKSWFDPGAWPDTQKVPGEGDEVVITTQVVLRESPADLTSITIAPTGRLVVAPGVITIMTNFIHIKGRMDVGSPECRYSGKLNIKLKGIRRIPVDGEMSEFGQKYIGVDENGILELHGEHKVPWTKLSETVEKTPVLFNLQRDVEPFNVPESLNGFVICIWDPTPTNPHMKNCEGHKFSGAGNKYRKLVTKAKDLISGVQHGEVVVVSVSRYAFKKDGMESFVEELETLGWGSSSGQSQLRNYDKRDAYAFVAQKGNPSLTREVLDKRAVRQPEAKIEIMDDAIGVKLSVKCIVNRNKLQYSSVTLHIVDKTEVHKIINVIDPVANWTTGDEILLASTDFNWEQAEVGTLVDCPECTQFQLKVDYDGIFTHFGKIIEGVDERGEVGRFTRNIVISGVLEDVCPPENENCEIYDYDTFGGHLKVVQHFADVHIQDVEFKDMGQQTDLGRYPIHFHMCYDVDDENYPNRPWVKYNSIRNSKNRCVTIHGTSGLEVSHNFCFDTLGHAYFLEDGSEQRTIMSGNFGAGQRAVTKSPMVPSDTEPATFWITNPKNYFQDNVGGGGDQFGYWFAFPYEPTGESANPKDNYVFMEPGEAYKTAIYKFANNVAHSYKKTGLFIDESVKEDLRTGGTSHHKPKVNPADGESGSSFSEIYKFTAYKNSDHGIWTSDGPFHVVRASIADCMVGIAMRGFRLGKWITQSVILGETENTGEPQEVEDDEGTLFTSSRSQPNKWQHPRQGVVMYQGPLLVTDSYFNMFQHSEELSYHAGAISFKAFNRYPLAPTTGVRGIKFGFDDATTGNRVYDGLPYAPESFNRNGNKVAMFQDYDGSVTSMPNTYVMRNSAYTRTAGCVERDNWNTIVCQQRHGKVEVNLKEGLRVDFFMTRDDLDGVYMGIAELEMGPIPKSFIARLGGDNSYTLRWMGPVPSRFTIALKGGIAGDYVRVGACVGKNADLQLSTRSDILSVWGSMGAEQMWVEVTDLHDVDNDPIGNKYYYDRSAGILYVKFIEHLEREEGNMADCVGKCPYINVEISGTTDEDGDCGYDEIGNSLNTQTIAPKFTVTLPGAPSKRPEEWGAGPTRTSDSPRDPDVFTNWGEFGECSKTCGGGIKQRTRTCISPLSDDGSSNCIGSSVDVAECGTDFCPKDGRFSEWSVFSQCQGHPEDTKIGFKTRERSCTNPAPAYGGTYCTGSLLEVEPCIIE